jgi:hypothetical protein
LSPKVMYLFVTIGTRLENHPLSPVICLEQLESINQMFFKSPAWNSKMSTWANKRLSTGVSTKRVKPVPSHLLKSGVSTIQNIFPTKATFCSDLGPFAPLVRVCFGDKWQPYACD